ncbi:hypothetical protein BJ969_005190 [Saccharopolyspora gloriosae]|uniref:DUF2537 domain-containing protein n=1 Tax=Saccharopolyspora gloriosae TaxID=455344 RepID=A0A840NSG8_9PSEU|nr:DUF2537 domain-containing protein [Saccharopolyspora gloriosae]MBB5072102.1 hypothetical protein [Saccharopolyspora gloriosae]
MTRAAQRSRWELRVRRGRAVLVNRAATEDQERRAVHEYDPARLALPSTLVEDLHEWAHVVHTVPPDQDISGETSAVLMSRRGRQLAARLAAETGGEVGYWDPSRGRMSRVRRAAPADGPPEPVPWATGITISVVIAAIVTVSLVVVSRGLAEVSLVLALLVNAVVVGGFAPSIWLGRRVPVWRWVAFGAAGGVLLAWLALLLSLLG